MWGNWLHLAIDNCPNFCGFVAHSLFKCVSPYIYTQRTITQSDDITKYANWIKSESCSAHFWTFLRLSSFKVLLVPLKFNMHERYQWVLCTFKDFLGDFWSYVQIQIPRMVWVGGWCAMSGVALFKLCQKYKYKKNTNTKYKWNKIQIEYK